MRPSSSNDALEPQPADPIEPGVRPLCDALNTLPGVQTLWSCEGHPERPTRPYVTFLSSRETAFALHLALVSGAASAGLEFNWWLTAHFDDTGRMRFTIEPNDYRIPGKPWPFPRRWNRQGIDRDLQRLADLVTQISA